MRLLVFVGALVALYLLLRKRAPGASTSAPLASSGGAASGGGLDDVAEAIARFEGFYKPGSLSQRTNNPGDIGTYGGQVGSYPDPGDGWEALNSYISDHASAHPDWDFYDFARYYLTGDTQGAAGKNQNPDGYAEYIAGYLGVDPTQTVSSVLQG